MLKASYGDTVEIHVEEKLEDGTLIYSTPNRDPLKFTIGEGKLIPGLEEAVIGMRPGEKKTAKVEPEYAFGPYKDKYVFKIDRYCIPPKIKPEVGLELDMGRPEDPHKTRVRIIELTESKVTMDMNHPLAGKKLVLDIEFLDFIQSHSVKK